MSGDALNRLQELSGTDCFRRLIRSVARNGIAGACRSDGCIIFEVTSTGFTAYRYGPAAGAAERLAGLIDEFCRIEGELWSIHTTGKWPGLDEVKNMYRRLRDIYRALAFESDDAWKIRQIIHSPLTVLEGDLF